MPASYIPAFDNFMSAFAETILPDLLPITLTLLALPLAYKAIRTLAGIVVDRHPEWTRDELAELDPQTRAYVEHGWTETHTPRWLGRPRMPFHWKPDQLAAWKDMP